MIRACAFELLNGDNRLFQDWLDNITSAAILVQDKVALYDHYRSSYDSRSANPNFSLHLRTGFKKFYVAGIVKYFSLKKVKKSSLYSTVVFMKRKVLNYHGEVSDKYDGKLHIYTVTPSF